MTVLPWQAARELAEMIKDRERDYQLDAAERQTLREHIAANVSAVAYSEGFSYVGVLIADGWVEDSAERLTMGKPLLSWQDYEEARADAELGAG